MTEQLTLNLSGCKRYFTPGVCVICGGALPGRKRAWCSEACVDLYLDNHDWGRASWVAKVTAGHQCQRCGRQGRMETNHRVPVNGGFRGSHSAHQDGLEVLCHDCHVDATMRQREAGLIGAAP